MATRFVCLANSYKEGGRCLAGILLDNTNKPISENGRPKWIRPVCNTPHGEVYTNLVLHINILDIIEIEITKYLSQGYQSENMLFGEDSLRITGKYLISDLNSLCETSPTIFGNKGKAVSEEAIGRLTHSLMLVKVTSFEVAERTYDDTPNKTQIRLVFSHNGNQYDFPVTDPVFLHNYQINSDYIEDVKELFLCLSLGVSWQNWYYKLVAGVVHNINRNDQTNLPEPPDNLPF